MIQTDQLWEDIYETVEKNWSILVLLNNYQLVRCDSGTVVILEGKKKKSSYLLQKYTEVFMGEMIMCLGFALK